MANFFICESLEAICCLKSLISFFNWVIKAWFWLSFADICCPLLILLLFTWGVIVCVFGSIVPKLFLLFSSLLTGTFDELFIPFLGSESEVFSGFSIEALLIIFIWEFWILFSGLNKESSNYYNQWNRN